MLCRSDDMTGTAGRHIQCAGVRFTVVRSQDVVFDTDLKIGEGYAVSCKMYPKAEKLPASTRHFTITMSTMTR